MSQNAKCRRRMRRYLEDLQDRLEVAELRAQVAEEERDVLRCELDALGTVAAEDRLALERAAAEILQLRAEDTDASALRRQLLVSRIQTLAAEKRFHDLERSLTAESIGLHRAGRAS